MVDGLYSGQARGWTFVSEKPLSILISIWPGLGDVMFSTPAIRLIKKSYPTSVLGVCSLLGGGGKPLIETNPNIDEIFFPQKPVFTPSGLRDCVVWAREKRFDIGIELSQPAQWFFRLAGIRRRSRFGRRALWWFVPYKNREGIELHASEHFIRAAEKVLGPLGRDGKGYDLFLTDADEDRAEEAVGGFSGGRFICIHPGARCNANKRWGIEKFVQLCKRLSSDFDLGIVIVGGFEDVSLGERIAVEIREKVLVLAGRLSLRETGAVIKRSLLYIGNDSGPIQIAASMNVPVVGIYASSSPENFGPLCDNKILVTPEDDCAPCLRFPGYMWLPWGLRLRYYNRCRAMENLGVDQVYEACARLLTKGQSS